MRAMGRLISWRRDRNVSLIFGGGLFCVLPSILFDRRYFLPPRDRDVGIGSDEFVSLQASCFLKSMILVVLTIFTGLDPMKRAADGPRVTQASHSREQMRTRLVRFFSLRLGRSVIVR